MKPCYSLSELLRGFWPYCNIAVLHFSIQVNGVVVRKLGKIRRDEGSNSIIILGLLGGYKEYWEDLLGEW